jgi:hypothetical protein
MTARRRFCCEGCSANRCSNFRLGAFSQELTCMRSTKVGIFRVATPWRFRQTKGRQLGDPFAIIIEKSAASWLREQDSNLCLSGYP